MMTRATTYVHGAERMVTAARLTADGVYVRFADERAGVIPFADLKLPNDPDHVTLPQPYLIQIHLSDGAVAEVPWDFARHYCDAEYRSRSEAAGKRGRHRLGQRLKTLRTEQGWTQAMLSERSNLNRVTIARIEAGNQLPRYSTLLALTDALDIPVERLLAGDAAEDHG